MTNIKLTGISSALLLGGMVIAVAVSHKAYLDLCVCVANSLARAGTCLAVCISLVAILDLVDGTRLPRLHSGLSWLQVVAFIAGIFFTLQHIYFTLEIV